MQIEFRRKPIASVLIAAAVAALLAASVALCELMHMVIPEASGRAQWQEGGATLDCSNAELGYIMARKASDKKLKLRVFRGENTYTYDLSGSGEYEVYPLQDGSGSYKISIYENVKGNRYAQLLSKSIDVRMSDEMAPFLCPNRYVNYGPDSAAVSIGFQLTEGLSGAAEKADAIQNWIGHNFWYDYITALNVRPGYIPDLDHTLETQGGICFDFASMMCTMLRTQGIPVKLVMGDADGTYHAWCSVWLDGEWTLYDPTAAVTGSEAKKYIEEACY